MKYQSLAITIICIAVLFIAIDSSSFLQNHIMRIGGGIKIFVLDSKDAIALKYNQYINQAHTIKKYQEKLKDYDQLELELKNVRNEIDALSLFDTQQTFYRDAQFLPARAYLYVGMGKYNRVWIDFDTSHYPEGRLFGIVQDGKALGIAIVKDRKLVGLLNGEKQSSYSVFIGDEKIPAIIHYNSLSPENIVADFIPSWKEIHIGDQVFTSGLDGIFIKGVLVGEVVSVSHDYGYITAQVKPYAKNFDLDYIWLVDTKVPSQTLPQDKTPF